MSLDTVKTYVTSQLEFGRDAYIKDLQMISEDDLLNGMNGEERKGIDFSYEVAYVNRRFAARLRGESPEAWPEDGWIVAPAQMRSKSAIILAIKESMDELISAWELVPASDMTRVIPLPKGETSPLDLVFSCCWHTGYHDAQLNYIQELKGDLKMHWQD
jgi:hypothetical protein